MQSQMEEEVALNLSAPVAKLDPVGIMGSEGNFTG